MSELVTDSRFGSTFRRIIALVSALWLPACQTGTNRTKPAYEPPLLFAGATPCTASARRADRGFRVERQGHLHAERYPYDPRDGIRAVARFQEAYSCYRDAGLSAHAHRARALSSILKTRINVDYASSRLALDDALARQHWNVALEEARRLLGLTGHLHGHGYVERLSSLIGKASARVDEAS